MLAPTEQMTATRPRLRTLLCVGASLSLHLASYGLLRSIARLPDPGFELTLPDTIELGMVEGSELVVPPATAAAPPEPAAATPAAAPAGDRPAPPKPKAAAKPKARPQPATPKDDPPNSSVAAREGLAALSPPGAQLALRVDLDRVRGSELAEDVRELLAAIPDVRLVLEGSEIDPLRDLSRLFLASPNLQRSRLVMAGQYRGDESVPRRAAENLARARGATLAWEQRGNVPVAAWHNLDRTERVLALLGPDAFAITRAEDLPRVLAIAQALAKRSGRRQRSSDALLAMERDQVVTFSVENAKLFARGATAHIPERLTVAVYTPQDGQVRVRLAGEFAGEAAALAASEFWSGLTERYARSVLVSLMGLSGPLERMRLERAKTAVSAVTTLRLDEVRLILRFLRDSLGGRPAAPRGPAADPATPASP